MESLHSAVFWTAEFYIRVLMETVSIRWIPSIKPWILAFTAAYVLVV